MYVTKEQPIVAKNGKIKATIEIKDNVLEILVDGDKVSYNGKEWLINGVSQGDGIYRYETDDKDILSQELFDNVFEQEEDNGI